MFTKMRELAKYILPFVLGVFIFALITNYSGTVQLLSGLLGGVWYILSPILAGFGLAYILNLSVKVLRKRLRFPIWLAIVASYVVLIGGIVWMVLYIMPYMIQSVQLLIDRAPGFVRDANDFMTHSFIRLDEQGLSMINTLIGNMVDQLIQGASSLIDMSNLWPWVRLAGRTVINIFFCFMISVYALIDKDRILRAIQRLMRAFMRSDKVEGRIQFCREANEIFSNYVWGKFLDSFLVGIISLILYSIFRLPITPFLAFLAFLSNMIPYFGPLIGGAISVVILLFFNPIQALYCLIICIAVQSMDGLVIGPRILGDSVGITPLLTLVAISIGGDLAGLLGIFLGVPVMAVLKILVIDRLTHAKLGPVNPPDGLAPVPDATPMD